MKHVHCEFGDREAVERLIGLGATVVPRRDWNAYGDPDKTLLSGTVYEPPKDPQLAAVLRAHIANGQRNGDAVLVAYMGVGQGRLGRRLAEGYTLALDADGTIRSLQRVVFQSKTVLNYEYEMDDGAINFCRLVPIESVSAWDDDDKVRRPS